MVVLHYNRNTYLIKCDAISCGSLLALDVVEFLRDV